MEKFRVVACAPPSCSCPTLTIENDVDGNDLVVITDDYNGISVMRKNEFRMLAIGFLHEYNRD